MRRWRERILGEAQNRFCDTEKGEELGWLTSHILTGFVEGYSATKQTEWIDRAFDWANSTIRRAVKEPDGWPGWPKGDGGGNESSEYDADSLLGEAMLFRPIIAIAGTVLRSQELSKWAKDAQGCLTFAADILEKWQSRDSWREASAGGVWVTPPFGISKSSAKWSAGYADRKTGGFSNPANKQNVIACWHLEMSELIDLLPERKAVLAEAGRRAEKWWVQMKSRMRLREDGKYFVWNYWDPAGPWDLKPDGSPRHWVGVHPNGGYYGIDVDAIAEAYSRGLVFNKADIERLIATNRDYMWNGEVEGAKFRRIDGEALDPRWKNTPGVLWTSVAKYDSTLAKIFVANNDPGSWGGITSTPMAVKLLPELATSLGLPITS